MFYEGDKVKNVYVVMCVKINGFTICCDGQVSASYAEMRVIKIKKFIEKMIIISLGVVYLNWIVIRSEMRCNQIEVI